MSDLKVNTISGIGSGGFTGSVASEGGATTTDLQQGLVKMFIHAAADTTPSDSFNVSGNLDNTTGDYTYTYTSPMRAADQYSSQFAFLENQIGFCYQRTNSTTTVRTDCCNSDGVNRDRIHGGTVVGDLA